MVILYLPFCLLWEIPHRERTRDRNRHQYDPNQIPIQELRSCPSCKETRKYSWPDGSNTRSQGQRKTIESPKGGGRGRDIV